jgi:hypothetical protein
MHEIDMVRVAAFASGIDVIADYSCAAPRSSSMEARMVNPVDRPRSRCRCQS